MWLILYNIYFIFYSSFIFYFTVSKKSRVEGIKKKIEVILPIISISCPVFLNFSGEFRELSITWYILVFLFFGLFISTWGLFTLRKDFSLFIEAVGIIKTGPYQYVKHPIYLGELLTTFGFVLIINTVMAYCIFILSLILVLIRANMEEKKLIKAFPNEKQYFSSPPAFIPFLNFQKKKS